MASTYNIVLHNICHLYNESNQLIGYCSAFITPEEMLNKPVELNDDIVNWHEGEHYRRSRGGITNERPIIIGVGAITATGRVIRDAAFVINYKRKWYMFSLSDLRLRPVVPNPVPNVSYLAQVRETLRKISWTHPDLLQNVLFVEDSGVRLIYETVHMPNVRHKKTDFAHYSNALLYKDKMCLESDEIGCWHCRLTEANSTIVVPDFAKPVEIRGEDIAQDVNILLAGGCFTFRDRVRLDFKNCPNVHISSDEYAEKMHLSTKSCNVMLNTQVPISGTLEFDSSIITQNCNSNCSRLRFGTDYADSVSLASSHLGSPLRLSALRSIKLSLSDVHEAPDSCPIILHNTFEDTLSIGWGTSDDSLIPFVIQAGNTPIRHIVFVCPFAGNEYSKMLHFLHWLRDYVSVQLANHVEIILAFKDESIVQSMRTSPEYKAAKHGISFRSSKFSWKSMDMDSLKRELK